LPNAIENDETVLIVDFRRQQVACPHLFIVTRIPEPLQLLGQYGQGTVSVSQHLISLGNIDAGAVYAQIFQFIRGKLLG